MTHYSLITEDRIIVKDSIPYQISSDDNWLNDYSSIHAIQIHDSSGEVELTSGENRTATSEEVKAVKDKWAALKTAHDTAIANQETAWQNNWSRVRQERNRLLEFTDWTVMPDSPLSSEKQQEYRTYRTNLRNIPETYSSNNASDITFSGGNVLVSGSQVIGKPA